MFAIQTGLGSPAKLLVTRHKNTQTLSCHHQQNWWILFSFLRLEKLLNNRGGQILQLGFFFWAKSSIIIEIRWWWLSMQPGVAGPDFQYPERAEGYIMHQSWPPPGKERTGEKGRRESWSCLPWPSIFWVSASPHLTCWRQVAAGWRAWAVSQSGTEVNIVGLLQSYVTATSTTSTM